MDKEKLTIEDAKRVIKELNLDMSKLKYTIDDLLKGMKVELEHGTIEPLTNVTDDDVIMTGKIALAHLNEFHDYYELLEVMEEYAKKMTHKKRKYKLVKII